MTKKYLVIKSFGVAEKTAYKIVENPCFILDNVLFIGEFDTLVEAARGLVEYLETPANVTYPKTDSLD